MNRREKMLAIATGVFVLGFVVYLVVKQVLLAPSEQLDSDIRSMSRKVLDLKRANTKQKQYLRQLRDIGAKSFGTNERQVANAVHQRLQSLLDRAGFTNENRSLSPVTGTSQPGVYREIGRMGTATGTLSNVVDFLYLLEKEPTLRRVDNVVVTPQGGGRVALQFKYTTLALSPTKSRAYEMPTSAPARTGGEADLYSKDRKVYNLVVTRDVLRPYIKRPPAPPIARPTPRYTPPTPRPTPRPSPPAAPAPVTGQYRVVGLPNWAGETEVVVKHDQTRQTKTYRPGDLLAKGKIVMVDYRPLPMPNKPDILSNSRVIIEIAPEYWAIELGQTLTEKRRLAPEMLPESLRKAPAAPAPSGEKVGAAEAG